MALLMEIQTEIQMGLQMGHLLEQHSATQMDSMKGPPMVLTMGVPMGVQKASQKVLLLDIRMGGCLEGTMANLMEDCLAS